MRFSAGPLPFHRRARPIKSRLEVANSPPPEVLSNSRGNKRNFERHGSPITRPLFSARVATRPRNRGGLARGLPHAALAMAKAFKDSRPIRPRTRSPRNQPRRASVPLGAKYRRVARRLHRLLAP